MHGHRDAARDSRPLPSSFSDGASYPRDFLQMRDVPVFVLRFWRCASTGDRAGTLTVSPLSHEAHSAGQGRGWHGCRLFRCGLGAGRWRPGGCGPFEVGGGAWVPIARLPAGSWAGAARAAASSRKASARPCSCLTTSRRCGSRCECPGLCMCPPASRWGIGAGSEGASPGWRQSQCPHWERGASSCQWGHSEAPCSQR